MDKYIGYKPKDYETPWAKFYHETVKPIAPNLRPSGPLSAGALPPLARAASLVQPGYDGYETGYTLEKDGSIRVAVRADMPGVSPLMWDWWFGWHGSLDNRYKLWHPFAHKSAVWADGGTEVAYIGRVSKIEELIGKKLEKANIAFVEPSTLGLPATESTDKQQMVFICARLGYTQLPLDFGWLVHQVRRTETGAEMRSRFWLGGLHVQIRANWMPQFASKPLQWAARLPESKAIDLLEHCSEEMIHLATFLPKIYQELHNS